MKLSTILKKVKAENRCSIATAEKIGKKMTDLGIISESEIFRFRPLYGDFDVVPRAWIEKGCPGPLDENDYLMFKTIDDLITFVDMFMNGGDY